LVEHVQELALRGVDERSPADDLKTLPLQDVRDESRIVSGIREWILPDVVGVTDDERNASFGFRLRHAEKQYRSDK
jgi:hypothetical protein